MQSTFFSSLTLPLKCDCSFVHEKLSACFMVQFIDAGNGHVLGIDSNIGVINMHDDYLYKNWAMLPVPVTVLLLLLCYL